MAVKSPDMHSCIHMQWADRQTWWRHQMETFSVLLAICAAQRPVTRGFDVFFDLRLNKRLSKQLWGWWLETLSRPLWRHCNDNVFRIITKQEQKHICGKTMLSLVSGKIQIYLQSNLYQHFSYHHRRTSRLLPHSHVLTYLKSLELSSRTETMRTTSFCYL